MGSLRMITTTAIGLALALAVVGCGQPSASTPSPSAAPSTSPAASTASPAASASQAPAASSKPAASSSPAAASSSAGSSSAADLAAKAKKLGDYSFSFTVTGGGQTMTGKTYISGTKTRQEMTVNGQETVILTDGSTQTAYSLMPAQKLAIKMGFSNASAQLQRPADRTSAIPSNAKSLGTETVDGKQAAVYQIADANQKGKYWIWTEHGVPLKAEMTGPQGTTTIQFTNYQFSAVPASVFDVPTDYRTLAIPTNLPVPGASGAPSNIPPAPTH